MASSHSSSAVRPRSVSARSKWQVRGVRVRLLDRHARAADVDEALRVAHDERAKREVEPLAVGQREVVGARDAHRAGLGVEARREGASVCTRPPTRFRASSTHDVVALSLQLVRRHEAGQPRTDDDDPLPRTGTRLEPALWDRPHVCGQRRLPVWARLRRSVRQVLGQIGGHAGPW